MYEQQKMRRFNLDSKYSSDSHAVKGTFSMNYRFFESRMKFEDSRADSPVHEKHCKLKSNIEISSAILGKELHECKLKSKKQSKMEIQGKHCNFKCRNPIMYVQQPKYP